VRARSVAFDAAVAGALLVLVELEAWTGAFATHRQGPHWAQAAGAGVAAAALAARRLRPLACVVTCSAAQVVEFVAYGAPEGMAVAVLPIVAGYAVAAYEDRDRALWGLAALGVLGASWLAFDPQTTTFQETAQGAAWLSLWLVAWLLGAYRRTRRLYVEGLVRERDERAATAVAEERSRIARELHDVIGHSVSVMTVQASAVRRLMRSDQARERSALESVEATGRDALDEMRRMVGMLRSGDDAVELAPQPSLDQLPRLVAGFGDAGLPVEVSVQGDPVPLSPGLDLTAYRVVQEGLTNALKHANASRASVCIRFGEALQVSVRDDGRGGEVQPGHGLRGMRERVALYGGTLSAAPVDGGFLLTADLPLRGPV